LGDVRCELAAASWRPRTKSETSASNPEFKKILDAQMDFRNDGNLWWLVAEYSFMIRTRSKG
jgi:TRAP-type mannitol/chloroaromatic compound transport system substrate-binding protein